MASQPNPLDEALPDFQFPQREAAFFYGLFLRGHSAEQLKRDIAVPAIDCHRERLIVASSPKTLRPQACRAIWRVLGYKNVCRSRACQRPPAKVD